MPAATYGVFATTVEAVYALAPEAERITDPADSRMPTPITEATVAGWILDLSAQLAGAALRLNLVDPGPVLDDLHASARATVACGAASYLEAARYPTRAGLNDSSYAGVLWARYQQGTAALVVQLDAAIMDAGPEIEHVGPESGPFGRFPDPFWADLGPYEAPQGLSSW